MTDDELKAAIKEQDRRLTELRTTFKTVVANWTGGAAPQEAVDIWTAILKEGDRLIGLLEQQEQVRR